MMRSASRLAAEQVRLRKRPAIERERSAGGLVTLASELYSVADVLVDNPRLRRALGDPATPAEGRAKLIGDLLAGQVSESAREIAQAVVSERWSSPWDMTDALETAGDDALFEAAERDQVLDRVVDELFRFERILDAQSELTVLLDEKPVDPARRAALLHTVLGGKAHEFTCALLEHAVRSQRKHTLAFAIDDLLEEAAARQAQSMARVLSAVELTREQTTALTQTLSEIYGRPITVRTAVAPAIRGGLVIRIGDEVIDGSVAARLASAELALGAHQSRQPIESRTRQGRH
jgi:F-type H+-transporting ATPase subunit delta